MSLNPYAAPQPAETAVPDDRTAQDRAGQARSLAALGPFVAWERLRIWYNLILMLVVVATALPLRPLWFSDRLLIYCIEGAILANICFCVGLVAESYLRIVGWWRDWHRVTLFIFGTLLAAFLASSGIAGPLRQF